jgi:hypothetical protein
MVELKIHCACGQKYKFEVEPVNNRMTFAVACPACGANGTEQANALLGQMSIFKQIEPAPAPAPAAIPPPPPVVPRPPVPSLSLSSATQTAAAVRSAPAARPGAAKLGVAPANPEQVEAEARAKILWGDKPDEVTHFLMIQGFTHEEASEKVRTMIKERIRTIRAKGVVKTLGGVVVTAGSGGFLWLLLKAGFFSPFVLGLVGLACVLGLWLLFNGLLKALAPGTQLGDASEED